MDPEYHYQCNFICRKRKVLRSYAWEHPALYGHKWNQVLNVIRLYLFDMRGRFFAEQDCLDRHVWQPESFLYTPTGNTFAKCNVISPVIARWDLSGLFLMAEVTADSIVIPAEGPSLGIAPPGCDQYEYRDFQKGIFNFKFSSVGFDKTDGRRSRFFFMTSPRLPVSVILPLPLLIETSIYRMSPPTLVHTSPIATPSGRFSW